MMHYIVLDEYMLITY